MRSRMIQKCRCETIADTFSIKRKGGWQSFMESRRSRKACPSRLLSPARPPLSLQLEHGGLRVALLETYLRQDMSTQHVLMLTPVTAIIRAGMAMVQDVITARFRINVNRVADLGVNQLLPITGIGSLSPTCKAPRKELKGFLHRTFKCPTHRNAMRVRSCVVQTLITIITGDVCENGGWIHIGRNAIKLIPDSDPMSEFMRVSAGKHP